MSIPIVLLVKYRHIFSSLKCGIGSLLSVPGALRGEEIGFCNGVTTMDWSWRDGGMRCHAMPSDAMPCNDDTVCG